MSGSLDVLALKEEDVTKMLVATTHLGSNNVNFQMEQYVYKRKSDGIHIINLRRTWEKLMLAARAIVAIEHPAEVFVISFRPQGQRAVLKFAAHTGATPIAGRFTPGAFTNQIQAQFREPRLLIVTDPQCDHQPITEASYVNIPVIAFCNTDSPTKFVDIAIPCNNKSTTSIGLMWWLLAREVLRLRGLIPRETKWDVVVDLFFYRDPDEAEKDEQASKETAAVTSKPEAAEFAHQNEVWAGVGGSGTMNEALDWAEVAPATAPAITATTDYAATPAADDWTKQVPPQDDWKATSQGGNAGWGVSSDWNQAGN